MLYTIVVGNAIKKLRTMNLRLNILAIFVLTASTLAGQAVKKCDGNILLITSRKVGKLDQYEIRHFLLTFGEECRDNAEYSEWSNELLFSLLDKQTELTLRTIEKDEKKIAIDEILEDLNSPVNDLVNVRSLILKVDQVAINERLKKQIIENLKKADTVN